MAENAEFNLRACFFYFGETLFQTDVGLSRFAEISLKTYRNSYQDIAEIGSSGSKISS